MSDPSTPVPPPRPPSVRPGDAGAPPDGPARSGGWPAPAQAPAPAPPPRPEPLDSVSSSPPDGSWEPLAEDPARAYPVPWRWWDAVVVFLLANVVVGGLVLAGLAAAGVLDDEEALLRASLIASAALTLVTLLAYCALRFRDRARMLLGPVRSSVRAVVVGGVVGVLSGLAINLGIQLLFDALGIELPDVQQEIADGLRDPAIAPFVFMSVAFVAPVAEELLFRGVLYQGLRRSLPLWPAIGLSSLAFGLSHVEPVAVVGTFAAGMIFAAVLHRTGTLVAAIAAHIGFNLPSAIYLMVGELPPAS